MKLVIVESPAKSKTLASYLGKDYIILSSFGHVRSIPSKKNCVLPEQNFEVLYENLEQANKLLTSIRKYFPKGFVELYLAMDPDREGEAIAWHILELFKENNILLKDTKVHRITFNAITKKEVLGSFKNTRSIDHSLVEAQKSRQCLDYLVGFTLSPLLWKKLPCLKSAGRVQSVALRIICEREEEIEDFVAQEYWSVKGIFKSNNNDILNSSLFFYKSQLEKFSIPNKETVQSVLNDIKDYEYYIDDINNKNTKRKPYAPFITSTLQQEAATKLGYSPKRTMSIAQKLYEGLDTDKGKLGLITYMRTDGMYIVPEVLNDIRHYISENFGDKYLYDSVRYYGKKIKNAQEAHEAIRPTDISIKPDDIKHNLTIEQYKLYSLIWKRVMASQMSDAIFENKSIDISSENKETIFRFSGSRMIFDGFYKIYKDYITEQKDSNFIDSDLKLGEKVSLQELKDNQHFTNPPFSYTEAKLVESMEKLGIGRPSTYATTISVLQERGYVTIENKKLVPDIKGRVAVAFLKIFFAKYVDYGFTATLEESLDSIAQGKNNLQDVLHVFWKGFSKDINEVYTIDIEKIIQSISIPIVSKFFKERQSVECDKCSAKMSLVVSAKGIFLGCTDYPECVNIKNVDGVDGTSYPIALLKGNDLDIENDILLNKGPYGLYIQNGSKKISVPKELDVYSLSQEDLLKISNLPYKISILNSLPIVVGKSFYGFYLLYDKNYYSLTLKNFFTLTQDNVCDLLEVLIQKKKNKLLKKKSSVEDKKKTSASVKTTKKTKNVTKKKSKKQ